jgi:hypothetical protein
MQSDSIDFAEELLKLLPVDGRTVAAPTLRATLGRIVGRDVSDLEFARAVRTLVEQGIGVEGEGEPGSIGWARGGGFRGVW